MKKKSMVAGFGVGLCLAFALPGCGPPLFDGTSVKLFVEEDEMDLETSRRIEIRMSSRDPYNRVKFQVDGLEVGWPSTEVGLYEGSNLVRLEYVIEHEFERVTYRTRYCDSEVALVQVDGEQYGLLSGYFAGEVCQFSSPSVPGTPARLVVGGAFAGTLDGD